MSKKYFSYIIGVLLLNLITFSTSHAEMVCIKEEQAVDIIALLDASEKDLERLSNCEELVAQLYEELGQSYDDIEGLTEQLIEAKRDAIEYKASSKRWKNIAIYTGSGAAGAVLIIVLLSI